MTRAYMDVSDPVSPLKRLRRLWPRTVVAGIVGVAMALPCSASTIAGLGVSSEVAERALREHPLHTLDGKVLTITAKGTLPGGGALSDLLVLDKQ